MNKLHIISFLLLFGYYTFAQQYNFIRYNVDNGLPQTQVNNITQDSAGYIWFSTQIGVVKFDGVNYTIYDKSKGIASNFIRDIFIDSNHIIWITTKEGLSKFHNDTIISYYQKNGLPSNSCSRIWENNGKIWVMTSKGLCFYQNNSFVKVDIQNNFTQIYFTTKYKNTQYIGTDNGIWIQNKSKFTPSEYKFLEQKKINNAIWKSDNTQWFLINNSEIIQNNQTNYKYLNTKKHFDTNSITRLFLAKDNSIWVATEGNGLFKYKNNNFTHYYNKNGMNNNSVLSLFEDIEGNIWIGGRNGIVVFNQYDPFTHYRQANNYTQMSVFGMIKDKTNAYWFTTYGNGISKFSNNKWTYYNKTNGLSDNRLFSVIQDNNNIWFSTAGHGLIKYDGKDFSTYDKSRGCTNHRIFKIIKDHSGNIWGCTQFGGLFKYNGNKFQFFGKKDGLTDNSVMTAIEDTANRIWIGSINNGLYLYKQNKIIRIKLNGEKQPEFIRSSYKDITNKIWFGTAQYGVFRIDTLINNKITCFNISKSDGLNSNNVYFVFCDSKNQIWVGTEKGINKITLSSNKKIKAIQTYGIDDGFIGVETSINGAMEDNRGDLWFGSNIGVTKYTPGVEKLNNLPPKIHIVDIKLFNKKTNWKKYTNELVNKKIPKHLELNHNKNYLTFKYIGICFTKPAKVRYKFKLKGFDNNWSPIMKTNEAVYTNIPPGDYTFMVKARNNNGIWNKKPATFSFSIKPPFWQKMWFKISIIILILLVIYLYVLIRIRGLKKSKLELEEKVFERTQEIEFKNIEIQEKNEELNQQNEEIAAQRDELESQRDKLITINNEIQQLYKEQTSSIEYAAHIQNAILPDKKLFKNHFADYFVYYKPLNIVSGDFYYVAKVEHWIITAAVDSTGHGVPGGFMSMLGMSFMNEIIYTLKSVETDTILNKLRNYVIKSLNQKGKAVEHKDGMEISLCAINLKTLHAQFSGANSPIVIIRNNNEQQLAPHPRIKTISNNTHTLYKIVPDKMPISIYPKMESFSRVEFQLFENDNLYMFTDGYADQFNLTTNKKITSKSLLNQLIKNTDKPMKEQCNYLKEYCKNWKSTNDQIDDILIIGIKIGKQKI